MSDTAVPAPASATAAEDASQPPMQTDEVAAAEAPRTKTEEETQWEAVQQNPADFTAWTALIGLAEKEQAALEKMVPVFDGFLAEYPLCYGYWKKYADHTMRLSPPEVAIDATLRIYERGVAGVAHSVELWTHFCTFFAEKSEDLTQIRALFERALAVVGTDFNAHILWDKYLEFEVSQEEHANVAKLYRRVFDVPLAQLDKYWEGFSKLLTARPVAEVMTAEEAAAYADAAPSDTLTAEQVATVTKSREDQYKATREEVAKRKAFEAAIKRPYFHFKPLDDAQLNNWRAYLEFEEAQSPERATKLHERCLVPCSAYPDVWLRYAEWVEKTAGVDEARKVHQRATSTFVKSKPEAHIAAALFEESHGAVESARGMYDKLLQTVGKGLIDVVIRAANFHRRQGDLARASALYKEAVDGAALDSREFLFLSMEYATFLQKVLKDREAARAVLLQAVEAAPDSKPVLMYYVRFECDDHTAAAEAVLLKLFAAAVGPESKLGDADKEDVFTAYVDYVQDYAASVKTVREVLGAYGRAYPSKAKLLDTRKRSAEFADESRAAKQQRATTPAAAAAPAAAAPAAAAAAAAAAAQHPAYNAAAYGQYPGYGYPGYAPQYPAGYGAYPQPYAYPPQAAPTQQQYAAYQQQYAAYQQQHQAYAQQQQRPAGY